MVIGLGNMEQNSSLTGVEMIQNLMSNTLFETVLCKICKV